MTTTTVTLSTDRIEKQVTFDAIPESRRPQAFSLNTREWDGQAENIRTFLADSR